LKSQAGYQNLLDFYELEEVIGKGHFGVVRTARSKESGE
jgi:hypothetical protein